MPPDNDALADAITTAVPILLQAMDGVEQVQRHFHPTRVSALAEAISPLVPGFVDARDLLDQAEFPDEIRTFGERLRDAMTYTGRALDGIVDADPNNMGGTMRAMRAICRAQELAYPLFPVLTPVSQYFLEPARQSDQALIEALAAGGSAGRGGVKRVANDRGDRGGFSCYIPETVDDNTPLPLVMALHGGTGHGADFLWSFVREARSRGFIVVAPTSQADTWSLMGEEADHGPLMAMLDAVCERAPVDRSRMLLTGMSDGATYTLMEGLREDSPFSHLAPFSGVLHPELSMTGQIRFAAEKAIYLVHGELDWMFPLETALMAQDELTRHGADLTFRAIEGLSHTFGRGELPRVLTWFSADLALPGDTA